VIVTVTLNPTLRVEYDAERVVPGAVNRVRRVGYRTGGRGLAVARHLHTFGHEVVAAGLVGGATGEVIRAELARAGIATQFTRIAAESRRLVDIADGAAGVSTGFAEPSPYITTEELGRLAADYLDLLAGATAVVLCGSLPDGMPEEIYGSFVSYAAGAGVPAILEAGGSALLRAADRGPALLIPDRRDADISDLHVGPATPVVVITDNGVTALTPDGHWRAQWSQARGSQARGSQARASQARGGPVSLDGDAARDALVAGFVPGIVLGWTWPEMLRHAVALASSVLPSGEADLSAYEETLAEVAVTGPAGSLAG
jgi:tagatose 6-phosphate kinase